MSSSTNALQGHPGFEFTVESVLPGRMPLLLKHYKTDGARRRPHPLAVFRGAWTSEFGALNRLYVLWEHRQAGTGPEGDIGSLDSVSVAHPELQGIVTGVERLALHPACVPMTAGPSGGAWDLRLYDVAPYRVEEYLNALMAVMPIRQQYSSPFGVWRQRFGSDDRIVHLWPYRDLAHRTEVRAAVAKEPEWQAFVEKAFAMLVKQRSSLLRRVDDLSID
jgi:NIPSNAP